MIKRNAKRALVGALLATSFCVTGAIAEGATQSYLVFFDFNKSDLTQAATKIVDKAAADALAGKPAHIVVTGYTDTVGSEKYNLELSRRRALAVKAELTAKGLSPATVDIVAKGKHDLLLPTGDGVKEPQNRRVTVIFPAAPAPAAPPKAEEKTAAAPAPAEAPAADTPPPELTFWAQAEAGITAAGSGGRSKVNIGHLFTDRNKEVLLNQVLLTAEKPLDPKATDYAVGFKLQGMVGSDARYTHFLGELDTTVKGRTQLDIVEANVQVHTPWFTEGGTDIKIGQFSTALGAEVIDAGVNTFYSKSYIFNYGLPLKHTGFLAINHFNETLDLYVGANSGINTSLGNGDNNDAWSYQGGFGLNGLADGKLTFLALAHIGPEAPKNNSGLTSIFDAVATYKPDENWTFVTELNYIHTDVFKSSGYGIAQYASYALNEDWILSGRAEYWNDADGFFVYGFPNPLDFVNSEKGLPNNSFSYVNGKSVYGAFTAGLNYKPATPPTGLQSLQIRPEIRFDSSLNSTRPFQDGKNRDQVTFGLDIVIKL
jgi:hypothetical protein